MSAPDLSTQIEQSASRPASAAADGMSVTSKSISELIAADQYLAQKTAIKKRRRGLYFSKIIPAGPVSDCGRTLDGSGFGGGVN